MADFLPEPVPDEVKPGAPVAPVRAVEIVVDGSERKTIGGSVVAATLPPIATAEVSPRAGTEATADALAALPVADDERSPSPEDPLFAADGKDAVVEAPVATARAISEEEAVEEALRRSLYDQ